MRRNTGSGWWSSWWTDNTPGIASTSTSNGPLLPAHASTSSHSSSGRPWYAHRRVPAVVFGVFTLLLINYIAYPIYRYSECSEAKIWTLPLIVAQSATDPSFRISMPSAAYGKQEGTQFLSGDYNEELKRVVMTLLPRHEPSTVVEIGTHVSFFGLYAAALGHRTIVFEPLQENIEKIKQSLFFNRFPNYGLRTVALSDWSGKTYLFYPKNNPSDASFHFCNSTAKLTGVGYHCAEQGMASELVKVDKLEYQLFEDVYFMSIDVMGHEAMVLAGATSFLKNHYIEHLFIRFYLPEESKPSDATQQEPLVTFHTLIATLKYHNYYPCQLSEAEPSTGSTHYVRSRSGTLEKTESFLQDQFDKAAAVSAPSSSSSNENTNTHTRPSIPMLFCKDRPVPVAPTNN